MPPIKGPKKGSALPYFNTSSAPNIKPKPKPIGWASWQAPFKQPIVLAAKKASLGYPKESF
jgi:hypothetical protein